MSQERPLDTVAPEPDQGPPSPIKRLRRTVLMRRRRRKARAVSLHLPNALQRLLAEQFVALQRSFMGSIEEKIRSALHAEMQERQAASLPNDVHEPSRQISETGGSSRLVKLRFVDADRPKDPLYTGVPVQWQNGKMAKVAIFEDERQIMQGNLSELQIEILAVHADFFTERGQEDFTRNEFNKQIYTDKGKEVVLRTINLTGGEAYLGPFFFTESSYKKKLRLTARVKRQDLVVRVQEAITDPFVVKDRRSESNEKSYPPSKEEAVHRLEKISLKGKRCNDLASENITTVKHLMRWYNKDKSVLQKLTGMKKDDWSTMIKHATTSDPGNKIYSYRVQEENRELLFNDFYDLVGTMINRAYVPYSVNDIDQFPQIKVNNWKMSAYKKFEELENSVGLNPDYFMSNGFPVRAVRWVSGASTSMEARTTCQCYDDGMTARHEFGEQKQCQENGFSSVQIFSNNDAGSSKQETVPFPQKTCEQTMYEELCQQDPSVPRDEIPCFLTQGNILDSLGSFSARPIIQSYSFAPVEEDSSVTALYLTSQHNRYSRPFTTYATGTSYPVADGVSAGTSSLDHVQNGIFSGLSSFEEWQEQAHMAGQGFVPASDELQFYSQFDNYEH